jgi:hypothetical protein
MFEEGGRAPWIFPSKIRTLEAPLKATRLQAASYQGRTVSPVGYNKPGSWKVDYRTLKTWLECVAKRYPHLPPTPVAMLLEIGMTGRNPAYREILDQLLESDPAEYKAALQANPWLSHGWVPLEMQMDALKAVLPYLMPRLETMAGAAQEEEDDSDPSDGWAEAAAKDPILRKRMEMIVMGRPLPAPDVEQIPEQ